jgi:hypothetical protein
MALMEMMRMEVIDGDDADEDVNGTSVWQW